MGCECEEQFVDEVGDSVERPKLAARCLMHLAYAARAWPLSERQHATLSALPTFPKLVVRGIGLPFSRRTLPIGEYYRFAACFAASGSLCQQFEAPCVSLTLQQNTLFPT